jgi:transposase-like protein
LQGKVLGFERRRRYSVETKARILEQSRLLTWRRQARAERSGDEGSMLLPVEIEQPVTSPTSNEQCHSRSMAGRLG